MKSSPFTWAIAVVLAALLGSAWILYSREPAVSPGEAAGLTEAAVVGYLAPDFTLAGVDGEAVSLSDLRGRPVVLNFWATWCAPCRAEMPHFQEASLRYAGRAAIIGVNQAEPASSVSDFASAFGITYPLLLDNDNIVHNIYGIRALPSTLFIGADGVVRELYPGIINSGVLDDRIKSLLKD